jgi:hypothetical protein
MRSSTFIVLPTLKLYTNNFTPPQYIYTHTTALTPFFAFILNNKKPPERKARFRALSMIYYKIQ